jgi:chromosomal replication initiator protein
MQVQMSRHEFNTWVRRTSLLSIANGVATIGAPSVFFKEGFENRYIGAVRDLISDLYIPIKQVRVVIIGTGGQLANGLPSSA